MFHPTSRTASVDRTEFDLTRREAAVLEELIGAARRIVTKNALEDRLHDLDHCASGDALVASVSRLRRKLAAAGSTVCVEAARGIGYRLTSAGDG